jgi:hypothetical protein
MNNPVNPAIVLACDSCGDAVTLKDSHLLKPYCLHILRVCNDCEKPLRQLGWSEYRAGPKALA